MFFLCDRLGKTMQELHANITPSELLHWQIYYNQDHWTNRIKQETPEGRANAIKQLIMGNNG